MLTEQAGGETLEQFRASLRTWLEAHVPDKLRGFSLRHGLTRARIEELRAWNRTLADAGWAAIAWPEEYGGRGASVLEQLVYAEEMHRAGAPGPVNPIGLSNIAPAIMQFGTEDQKARHLERMRRGADLWCQAFSEPEAGSDLASLRTSAHRVADAFVVNGQKVWTTLGPHADWCEVLVRTDPGADRPHRGISALLVDMHSPGIEVRPLRTLTGGDEFSEIFFSDVAVPTENLLGPENGGWRVAMTTLTYERAGVVTLTLRMRGRIDTLLAAFDGTGTTPAQAAVRRDAVVLCLTEQRCLDWLGRRIIATAAAGADPGVLASLAKLRWSLLEHRLERAVALLGPVALEGAWADDALHGRSASIAGGTTEIQKTLLADRYLGLPREIKA
ncbi:MAG: acyl-CoA dehydrogenase family protein [Acidimicrobiia bacterium]|nr:acyl-CoA dehydrogenase family protein [Acidimicrobiia bacterium]